MAAEGAPGRRRPGQVGRASWKRHIIRQLQHRDRTQTALFQDVIQSYNKLLEKSYLLKHLTESLQKEQHARFPEEVKNPPGPDEAQTLINQQQRQMEDIANHTRELAIEAVELKKRTQEQDAKLEEQKTKLMDLADNMAILKQEQYHLQDRMLDVECANSQLKHQYDTLLCQRQGTEELLQQAEENKQEVLQDMMKKKGAVADKKNRQIDRSRKARWFWERKEAMLPVLRLDDAGHPPLYAARDSASLDRSACEERGRPVDRTRSQSVSSGSMNVIGAIRGLLDRVRSDSCSSVEFYPLSSVCVLCCLPSIALCNQEVHDSEVHAVKFSPNSRMVATGGADRVIKIWDVEHRTLQACQTLEGSSSGITSIEFDPSGLQILASSYNGAVHLWRLQSRSNDSLTGHQSKVTAAKFSMIQNRVVTCSMDRTVREWDLHKAACIRHISVQSYCTDVVCSDYCMVSGHYDKKIRFWDSRTSECCKEITLEDKVTSLCFNQDQRQLLSCSRDDVLNLIDLRTNKIWQEFRADGFKCGCDWTKAILSPDGSYAIAGSVDGTIFIWNTQTGLLEKTLDGQHRAAVNAVTWSMCGSYVVSVDRGKKAVLWSEY